MIRPEEARHVESGPRERELPGGIGLTRVEVHGDARHIEENARMVMGVILRHDRADWPTVEDWRDELPASFLEHFAPERTDEEVQEELRRYREGLSEGEAKWALSDWLFWLDPDERHWFWWSSRVVSDTTLVVEVETEGWPTPYGALKWMLKACGAEDVEIFE